MTNKELILKFSKQAYSYGLFAGTSGNLSIMERDSDLVYITPGSVPYESMTEEDIVVIDRKGNVVEGTRQPSSEWRLHMEIYNSRPEANAVVHTHSPYATAFAVLGKQIPLILVEMLPFLGDTIQIAQFALPGEAAVGEQAVIALQGRKACLLQNHGAVALGCSLEDAYTNSVYLEDAAKIYHMACTVGTPNEIPAVHLERFRARLG